MCHCAHVQVLEANCTAMRYLQLGHQAWATFIAAPSAQLQALATTVFWPCQKPHYKGMLQTAMQQAPAAAAAVGKSAAYAAAAEAQQQQQKQVLRLAQFSSDAPYAASLLGYLPGSQPNSTRCQHGIQ
jgi:hypothetical protein